MISQPALSTRRGLVLLAVFLVSGATSLVYQVLWVRVLSLTLGSTVYSISLVVSAFMAGLALGSALFGRWADRVGRPLRTYAFLELGIGAAAFVLPAAFVLLQRAATAGGTTGSIVGSAPFSFLVSFLLLLVPTTLMGGTLPVLSRAVSGFRTPRGTSIGALYAANTLGAILGSVATGLFLIRLVGIQHATWIAAAGNVLVFGIGLLLARSWPLAPVASGPVPSDAEAPAAEDSERALLGPVSAVYFVNGFAGLALEVLWTRAILLLTTNTIYAFTVILTTFLAGLTAGSALMSVFVARLRRPGVWLGALQCATGFIVALTPVLLGLWSPGWLTLGGKDAARGAGPLAQSTSEWVQPSSITHAYVVAALFILPATLLLGASFPLVARVVAGATQGVGRAVGRIYALNTVGAMIGSLVAGFVALPFLGIQRSIALFAGLTALAGWWLLGRSRARAAHVVGLASAATAIVVVAACPNVLRTLLARILDAKLTHYEEGVETTVAVYDSDKAARPVLVINNNALDDRGVVHKLLVHVPMLMLENPRRALVLGYGVGISNESLSAYDVPVNDCVEISKEVMNAAPFFAALNGNITDRGDPDFHVYIEDGRKHLLRTREPYDLIVLDANSGNLRNAGVGKLYTRDFFELCRDRLSPNGFVSLYVSPNGTLREWKLMARTFREVFPNTSLWVDRVYGQTCLLVGSRAPLEIDVERMLEKLDRPKVRADLRRWGLDQPGALLACFVAGPDPLREFCAGSAMNTDDRPLLEFFPVRLGLFDGDDRMFSDAGFHLVVESVLPYLRFDGAGEPGEAVRGFLAAEDRSTDLLLESWVHRWNGNAALAATNTRVAASIHPGAEYLRQSLGYGEEAASAAAARAEQTGSAADLGRAGLIAYRRGEHARARDLLARAVAAAGADTTSHRMDYYVGLSRCQRELGELPEAEASLATAARLGFDDTSDRLEMELRDARGDPSCIDVEKRLLEASLTRLDLVRGLELSLALRGQSALDPAAMIIAARTLEAFGDDVGAYILYREVRARLPASPDVGLGLERTRAELGLRVDLFEKAGTRFDAPRDPLVSPFLGTGVAPREIPARDYRAARSWLEVGDLYLQGGLTFAFYRKARAARTMEPTRPEPYMAIGRAASALGNTEVARLAFRRAIDLGIDRRLVPADALTSAP